MNLIFWAGGFSPKVEQLVNRYSAILGSPVGLIVGGDIPSIGKDDLVACLGESVLGYLAEAKLVPKNRKVQSLRFPYLVNFHNGGVGLITYSPSVCDYDYEKYVTCLTDLSLAVRYVTTGSFKSKVGEYVLVEDFQCIIDEIEQRSKIGGRVDIAVDIETVGLDYLNKDGWILSIQVAITEGKAYVKHISSPDEERACLAIGSKLHKQLNYILNSPTTKVRGAGFKYDALWFRNRAGIQTFNSYVFDTLLVGSLLDENRSNSLNAHTKIYVPELGGYDDEFNNNYDKSRMDLVPLPKLVEYGGGDVDATLRVSQKLKEELVQDNRLTAFYVEILHPASKAFISVENTGICIDLPYYLQIESELKCEISRLEKEAFKEMGGLICAKYADNLKLSRSVVLKEFFFGKLGLGLKPLMVTPKTQEPSTSLDHLFQFSDVPKAKHMVEILKDWSSATKTLSTYVCRRDATGKIVSGFLKHLRSDGRFHPSYFLFNAGDDGAGTNTGRLSAKDPAYQTIPKHTKWAKKLRKAYIAPEGYVIVAPDYSQGELKIVACLANEKEMIKAYRQGMDLHAITASEMSGYSLEDILAFKQTNPSLYDDLRTLGKAGNFGLLYGMREAGFVNYALLTYGVKMTMNEALQRRDKFFNKYPGLLDYHSRYQNFARQHKFVRSPLGRIRHLPLIASPNNEVRMKSERQAINSPVQSTLSDFSLWALGIMEKEGVLKTFPVFGQTHDQIVGYAPQDRVQEAMVIYRQIMENLPFSKLGWEPQLSFTVDFEVGLSLGELDKVK